MTAATVAPARDDRADVLVGLLVCVAVASVARLAGSMLQLGLETALALVLGLAVGAIVSLRPRFVPGATLASRYALRIGITLLGARLTLDQLFATGTGSIIGIAVVVTAAL
ncbi:MAG TPA: putative sulfate exporter family transporter, partial [Candidatus Limnocylindrales bacterium]|nr:putative sulfate exporter family transporter [Candidatus Limnocylindrales bacterium]